MDVSSYAANTQHTSNGLPSEAGVAKIQHPETATLGEDMLTSVAIQQKFGNLALCFPNS